MTRVNDFERGRRDAARDDFPGVDRRDVKPDGRPTAALQRRLGNQAVQRLAERGDVQAKLTVGSPNDRYEREADRVADRVVGGPARPASGVRATDESGTGAADGPASEVQRRSSATDAATGAADAERPIRSLGGGGRPLPDDVRSYFERRFDAGFGDVRIHTGGRADEAARAIDARAFTMDDHVVFGTGEYAPGTTAGKRLLAHELTHVVQQRGALAGSESSNPDAMRSSATSPSISGAADVDVQRQSRGRRRRSNRRPNEAELRTRRRLRQQKQKSMERQVQQMRKRNRKRSETEKLRLHRINRENFDGWIRTHLKDTGTSGTRGLASNPTQAAASLLGELHSALSLVTVDEDDPLAAYLASVSKAQDVVDSTAAMTRVEGTPQWYGLIRLFGEAPVIHAVGTDRKRLARIAHVSSVLVMRPLPELTDRFEFMSEFEEQRRERRRRSKPLHQQLWGPGYEQCRPGDSTWR